MKEKNQNLSIQIHIPILIRDLLRNIWLVILAGVIAVMGVFCYANQLHKPEYTTTVTFAVSPRSNGSYVGFYNSLRTASEMAEVFNEVFSSDVLKRLVQEDLGDPNVPVKVSASLKEGTNILQVSTKANDPLTSYNVMDAVMRNYGKVSEYLFGNVVLDTIKSPHIPTAPSNPMNMVSSGIMMAALAMLVMTGVIVLLSIKRNTLKTLSGAKLRMGEAPLGVLAYEKSVAPGRGRKTKGLLIWKTAVSFRYTEAMLQLGFKLFHRMQKENKKVLLITSVAENDGKSTLAANLAIAISKHGHKVALVDMDLRKPALHKLFSETEFCVDLRHALEQGVPQKKNQNLFVFTAKDLKGNIGALLHNTQLDNFLQELCKNMDIVILDSAPYGAVADTGMLLKFADGCVLSARQDWVPSKVLKDVTQELDESKADYMGYVLNYYLDDGSLRQSEKKYKNYS